MNAPATMPRERGGRVGRVTITIRHRHVRMDECGLGRAAGLRLAIGRASR